MPGFSIYKRLQEDGGHLEDANEDYERATRHRKPKPSIPYERLSWLAARESKWQDLVDRTDQWLRLDPLNSPDVYYLSSLGNLQTKHYDIAEKNARESIRLDPAKEKYADALYPRPAPGAETRLLVGEVAAVAIEFINAVPEG